MSMYRKKPVVIEALRLTSENAKDVCDWIHGGSRAAVPVQYDAGGNVSIETLEGTMTASVGDWVIRGVQGEFYPCKPDIFAATYDALDDADHPSRLTGQEVTDGE